jgi:hypothetical protein
MYVAPRPHVDDDPLFAVRLALAAPIGFLVAIVLQSPMPMLFPALFVGLIAGMRKAFDIKRAVGGPIAMIVMMTLASVLVTLTRPMPVVLITVMGCLCFVSYYLILKTGNPVGMLIAIATVLMSIMGMQSLAMMDVIRDGFVQASLAALPVIPLLYALIPPRSREMFQEVYTPDEQGRHGTRAAIRGGTLLLLSFWLYSILDPSNLILAVAAVFVLVLPTREQQFAEAWERSYATLIGGGAALLILGLFTMMAHPPILLALVFLGGLFFASKMMDGRHPPMVYQFAFSVMVAIVGGALTTQQPVDATVLRIVLTLVGAVSAALLSALLEALLLPQQRQGTAPS